MDMNKPTAKSGQKRRFSELLAASPLPGWKRKYGYLAAAFLLPLLIYWLIYICMGTYPFGKGSVLVLDLNGQYVYFFEALHNILRGDASYFYSWSRSLGGEFIGIYAYYLASPLSYLVALFPSEHLTEALLAILLIKCGTCGATMTFYLKRHRPNANIIGTITMSTCFALSSYMIAYAHNTMWIDAMMLLPLTLYGAEQLITKGKFKMYVICLTLTLISTFYIGWMTCIFLLFYFFYYYFTCNVRFGDNNYYGERFHFLKSLGRMGVASLTAVMIACIIIIPTYYALSFGKNTFSDPSWELASQFDLIEFFGQLLPGSYDTVRPEGVPFIYCGLLSVILLPIYFISKQVSAREKIGGGIMLMIMAFCMNNSIVDLIFHGFQRPNWLNYRYSFMFIFLVVVFSARALEHLHEIKFSYFIAVGAGILGLILLVQAQHYEYLDDFLCIWISILFLGANLAAIGFAKLKRLAGQICTIGIAAVCCVELFLAGILTTIGLDMDVVYSNRTGYVQFMNRLSPTVSYIQENDPSFYRMEKTVFRTVCDNMALNIRGLSNSTSTLNASTIRFLNQMGYSSTSHWSKYLGGTPVNDSLLGLKYIIYESDSNSVPELYSQYCNDSENNLSAYLNSYALSLAYAASDSIKNLDISDSIDYASPFVTMNEIITALLGEDETVEVFKPVEYSLTLSGVSCTYRSTVSETLLDSEGNKVLDENGEEFKIYIPYFFYEPTSEGGTMTYTLNFPEDYKDGAPLYFFFCSNYPREVSWTFDNNGITKSGTFFANESDCIQSLGNVSSSDFCDLTVKITNDSSIFYLMQDPEIFYYLDEEVFIDAMTRLAEGNFLIDADYSESHLTGTVNVPEGESVLFTSIPYDEGWNVYVDGEKVEIYKTLNALIALDITPGQHTVEFLYRSSAMVYGWILCAIGVVIFVILCLMDFYLIRPGRAAKREAFVAVIERRKAEDAERYRLLLERADKLSDGASSNDETLAKTDDSPQEEKREESTGSDDKQNG